MKRCLPLSLHLLSHLIPSTRDRLTDSGLVAAGKKERKERSVAGNELKARSLITHSLTDCTRHLRTLSLSLSFLIICSSANITRNSSSISCLSLPQSLFRRFFPCLLCCAVHCAQGDPITLFSLCRLCSPLLRSYSRAHSFPPSFSFSTQNN